MMGNVVAVDEEEPPALDPSLVGATELEVKGTPLRCTQRTRKTWKQPSPGLPALMDKEKDDDEEEVVGPKPAPMKKSKAKAKARAKAKPKKKRGPMMDEIFDDEYQRALEGWVDHLKVGMFAEKRRRQGQRRGAFLMMMMRRRMMMTRRRPSKKGKRKRRRLSKSMRMDLRQEKVRHKGKIMEQEEGEQEQ